MSGPSGRGGRPDRCGCGLVGGCPVARGRTRSGAWARGRRGSARRAVARGGRPRRRRERVVVGGTGGLRTSVGGGRGPRLMRAPRPAGRSSSGSASGVPAGESRPTRRSAEVGETRWPTIAVTRVWPRPPWSPPPRSTRVRYAIGVTRSVAVERVRQLVEHGGAGGRRGVRLEAVEDGAEDLAADGRDDVVQGVEDGRTRFAGTRRATARELVDREHRHADLAAERRGVVDRRAGVALAGGGAATRATPRCSTPGEHWSPSMPLSANAAHVAGRVDDQSASDERRRRAAPGSRRAPTPRPAARPPAAGGAG